MTRRVICSIQVVSLCLVSLLVTERQALAQNEANRGGFTILVNLGVGIQNDSFLEETSTGVAGLNLGIGGFLTRDLALMGRFSGTTAVFDEFVGFFGEFTQVSGVMGATLQYWPSDRFYVEAGPGVGVWSAESSSDQGFGLITGAGVTIFNRGKHNLQVGFEYAPAFTDPGTVHNIGITFGYQFL